MKKYSKGFTLIELLVVIAIIGILSSVVLASLNTARNKGSDAAAKAGMAQIRNQAELLYDASSTYAGITTSAANIITNIGQNAKTVHGPYVSSSGDAWAMGAELKGTGFWCVDSTGASKPTGAILPEATSVCPAS